MPDTVNRHGATEYFKKVAKPYYSLPAEKGAGDKSLVALARRFDLSSPKVVMDAGCGQGRLLAAMKVSHSPEDLSNLHYVGVDSHPAALEACSAFFEKELASTGATACFMESDFFSPFFLADYVVLVFTLHEIDSTRLDKIISLYWRAVRRGGSLLVQDTDAAIHDEIEYLPFSPEDVSDLLAPLDADIQYEVTVTGRRGIPVFLLEAKKKTRREFVEFEYVNRDLSEAYRSVLQRSILRDCTKFLEYRALVESHSEIDTADLAQVCHRLAIKSRGYHQTSAYDLMESTKESFCLKCGSLNVNVEREESTVKDPATISLTCEDCGAHFEKWFNWNDDAIFEMNTTKLLAFLDQGMPLPRYQEWYLDQFFRNAMGMRVFKVLGPNTIDIWLPMLSRVPDLTSESIRKFINNLRRPIRS